MAACAGRDATTAAGDGPVTPVTAVPGATEQRPEILRLGALETLNGGSFDPDSVAGVDVLLWFWGPH